MTYEKLQRLHPVIGWQVCPQLSLPLIRRILSNFVPDEFSPDPVSPALLAAINAEVAYFLPQCRKPFFK